MPPSRCWRCGWRGPKRASRDGVPEPKSKKRSKEKGEPAAPPAAPAETFETLPPKGFVLAAAAIVGFAFLLMELVWYRMLAPLLGGSTYTYGLVLAIALAGIGLGAWLYSRRGLSRPATLAGLAATCALESLCLALALGSGRSDSDRGRSAASARSVRLRWLCRELDGHCICRGVSGSLRGGLPVSAPHRSPRARPAGRGPRHWGRLLLERGGGHRRVARREDLACCRS